MTINPFGMLLVKWLKEWQRANVNLGANRAEMSVTAEKFYANGLIDVMMCEVNVLDPIKLCRLM